MDSKHNSNPSWPFLRWPIAWERLPWWKRFLWGLSFVGTNEQVWDSLCSQMRLRNSTCLLSWQKFSNKERDIARRISQVVQLSLNWPNDFFIPEDPFQIMVWDQEGDLGTEATLGVVEKELEIPSLDTDCWKGMLYHDFGHVVMSLSNNSTGRE